MGHEWKPIEGLPEGWATSTDTEVSAIHSVWRQYQMLLPSDVVARLLGRITSEWSIETGMVEDLYHWDHGVTETLLELGVRSDRIPSRASAWPAETVAQIIFDQNEVVEGLFAFVKSQRPLGTSFIHELHAQLIQHQPKNFEAGTWKKLPNSVRLADGSHYEYCPPEHVASEIDVLLRLFREYESTSIPPAVLAAWLHHRFTQIHPYPDGNGRVARALASIVMIKMGVFPVIVRSAERKRYYAALSAADEGDLAPLVEVIRREQRRLLVTTTRLGGPVTEARRDSSSIIAQPERELLTRCQDLKRIIEEEFNELRGRLEADSGTALNTVGVEHIDPVSGYGFPNEYVDYAPDVSGLIGETVFLRLKKERAEYLVCSIHQTGRHPQGIAACVVYIGNTIARRTLPDADGSYFLIAFTEDRNSLMNRFYWWLKRRLEASIVVWRG